MDKQKQIEEREMIALKNTVTLNRAKKIAMDYYNAGYRKIPENAVVLTREEHIQIIKDLAESNAKTYETAYERGSKETAEKFAERLKAMAYQSTDWSHGEHPMVVEVDYIDEICEEITEGEKEISNETI